MKILRIIPVTIATAALFMAMKVVDVSRGTGSFIDALIGKVQAQDDAAKEKPAGTQKAFEPKREEPKKDAKADKDKDKEKKPDAKDATKADEKKTDAKAEDKKDEKKEEKKEEAKEEGKEGEKKDKNPNVSDTPGEVMDRHFSASEIEILKNLSKRRDELDRWERNIQVKESTLSATEKRIEEKLAQIDVMKKAVADLLEQYNKQEDAKIKSLVKIYENMKPGDAARIFNEVEMPILLLVIDKMSEKKAAPILAQMEPKKAKQITVELAAQRRLDTARLNNAAPAAGSPPKQ
jgi:flagellar motility protein MotE (MotC chaperone)